MTEASETGTHVGAPVDRRSFDVDPYPASIQIIAFFSFIGMFVATYIGISVLFAFGVCNLLGMFGGLVAASGTAIGVERLLRGRVKSHREVHVAADQIAFTQNGTVARSVDPAQHVNITMWHFRIRRRSRVPKGWYVVAICLEQAEIYLPVYMLVSPDDFEDMPQRGLYADLAEARENLDDGDLRLAGRQRRLMTAETARSIDGVEMLPEDFSRYVEALQVQFPGWMAR